MGAWGFGSFENDDASDFLAEAMDSGDLSLVREAFDNVLTSTEYVEAPDACVALVAAEIVAVALGRPSLAAQRKLRISEWVSRIRPAIDADLVVQAREVLSRILAPNSELRELWKESDDFSDWQQCVQELGRQLQG